jgi:tetratricopeptide (TPR) repeat protein
LDDAYNAMISINRTLYNLKLSFLFITWFFIASLFGCSFSRLAVFEDPLTSEEHLALGLSYEKKGELDSAINEYQAACLDLPLAYLYLGNAYFNKNEFDAAEKNYKKAIEKITNPEAFNNLAWLYYVKKTNLEEAEQLSLKALELNPSQKETYCDTLNKIRELKKTLNEK